MTHPRAVIFPKVSAAPTSPFTMAHSNRIFGMGGILVIIGLLLSISTAFGQAASATWSLTSDGSVSVSGSVTGTSIAKGSGVGSFHYGSYGVRADDWDSNSRNTSDYFQYAIAPNSGKDLTVTSISFYCASSGADDPTAAVYYSTDNFSSSTQLGSNFTVTGTYSSQNFINYTSLSISVPDGSTLRVRVYAWGEDDDDDDFYNKTMVISGVTSSVCTPPSQASGLSISGSVTTDGFTNASWTSGSGSNGTMLVLHPSAQSNATPYSGTSYTANTAWASAGQIDTDNRVVYRNSGTSIGSSITGLSVNTQYVLIAYSYTNATPCYNNTSPPSAAFYTLANVPGTPTVDTPTHNSINVAIAANGNPSNTTYAIKEAGGLYVQADGSLGASVVWQSAATWGTQIVTGLTGSSTYSFSVKARNGDNIETAFSAAASATTLTALSGGDVAFVALGPNSTDKFAFILLKDIAAGTVIHFTDNGFASTTTGRTGEGFVTYTAPADKCAGTIVTWINNMGGYQAIGWNSNNPSGFSLSDPEQMFAFQGTTGNWATQSGITLLAGIQAGRDWITSGSASSSKSYNPSALDNAYIINFTSSSQTDVYYPNTSLSGTVDEIRTTLTNTGNFTKLNNTGFTMPAYNSSFSVTVANLTAASASSPCIGGSSTVTINSTTLASGDYTVTYNLTDSNTSSGNTAQVSFTSGNPGSGTFIIPAGQLDNAGSTTVTITSIKANVNDCSQNAAAGTSTTFIVKALAAQPADFTTSDDSVCLDENGVTYTVPNDASVTYNWSYSGTGYTINGSGNSVTVDFSNSATSGNISVTATNSCNTSSPRSKGVIVYSRPTAAITPGAPFCNGSNGNVVLAVTGTGSFSGTIDPGAISFSGGSAPSFNVNVSPSQNTIYTISSLSDSHCTAYPSGLSGAAEVTVIARPKALITGNQTICSGQNAVLTINTQVSGSYSGTLSPGNIPFSGNGPIFTKTVTPGSSTTYTVASLTKGSCSAIPALDLVGQAVVTVNAAPTWYYDQDGDGYGDANTSQVSCTQPAGYVALGTDCDDDNEDMNPGADEWFNGLDDNCDGQIDENVSGITLYRDLDGDGYGDPYNYIVIGFSQAAGYVSDNSDCDDTSALIHPGVIEICNGIDDDCDGDIDEGCGPANDYIEGGQLLTTTLYPNNPVYTAGTLAGAHADNSFIGASCVTGEDVWYYFTAGTSGARIICNSSAVNILIELRSGNNLVNSLTDTEDIQSVPGNEILNYGGLTPGNTYFVRIRNYNSGQGTGGFHVAVQDLQPSHPVPNGPYDLCTPFKAAYLAGAPTYQFIFSLEEDPETVYSVSQGNNMMPLYYALGQNNFGAYNTSYNATINVLWTLTRGNNSTEVVTVPQMAAPLLFTLEDNPPAELKSGDRCQAGAKSLYNYVSSTFMCGAADYKWEFEELIGGVTPSGQPFSRFRGTATNLIQLSSVNGLHWGKTYRVKVAPVYGGVGNNGILGAFGPWQTLCIMNQSMASDQNHHSMVAFGAEQQNDFYSDQIMRNLSEENVAASLYPNPNNGQSLFISYAPNDFSKEVNIRITDAFGKTVLTKYFAFDQELSTTIDLSPINANGVYFVEFIGKKDSSVHKLIIQK
ncbi:MAG: T9SS type A sorting domain-containing protein [Crocinitomicaceae bacterium]|nr:T9SS type A sorting domain-containing protein [Crocinitomicaceae bacterium]